MSKIEIIRPGESVAIDPAQSGFAHGFAVFETILVADGLIQFWKAHWERLSRSAQTLGVELPCEGKSALVAVRELLAELNGGAHAIKLSAIKESGESRLLVYSRPAFPAPEEVGLLVDGSFRLNEWSPLAGLKTHNYIENMHFMEIARSRECYDLARFNSKGEIVEGAGSNLFWAKNGQLFTPDARTGLLSGVVRQAILSEMDVSEGFFFEDELLDADEVFLTNSIVGAIPVEWMLLNRERVSLGHGGGEWHNEMTRAIQTGVDLDSVQS